MLDFLHYRTSKLLLTCGKQRPEAKTVVCHLLCDQHTGGALPSLIFFICKMGENILLTDARQIKRDNKSFVN